MFITSEPLPISSSELKETFSRLSDKDKIAVAVSGGADSLALMHLIADWRQGYSISSQDHNDNNQSTLRQPRQGDTKQVLPDIHIMTVDHKLRPEAAEEALFVKQQAETLGLPHTILEWDGPKPQTGIQEKARLARYNLMVSYCQMHNIPTLLTAHHLNDQIETFFMRLQRGSGLAGLGAMLPVTQWQGVEIMRPLLDIPKERLIATLKHKNLTWCSDPNNKDPEFERVRIREKLQHVAELGFNFKAIGLSLKRLQRAHIALEDRINCLWPNVVQLSEAGSAFLQTKAFWDMPEEIALRILARCLDVVGRRDAPQKLSKLEAMYFDMKDTFVHKQQSAKWALAGCLIVLGEEFITFVREVRDMEKMTLRLDPGENIVWDQRFRICFTPQDLSFLNNTIWVKPLTHDGYLMLKNASNISSEGAKLLSNAFVREGLLSFWFGDTLLAVPHVGYINPNYPELRPDNFHVHLLTSEHQSMANGVRN